MIRPTVLQTARSIKTPHGNVDAGALERLRQTFDTAQLLEAVEQLDAVCAQQCSSEGLHAGALRLHSMMHQLLNDGPMTAAASDGSLGDCLTDIEDDLDAIEHAIANLRKLVLDLKVLPTDDE